MAESSDRITDGIRFECSGCGVCCTGAPGTVGVSDPEIDAIAEYLGMSRQMFIQTSARRIQAGISLRERKNYDCWFYQAGKCRIYPVRPAQCRTWPFWLSNLRSAESWCMTEAECPGIGKGRLYSKEQILKILDESPI